ncbi:metal-sensing transcriptional repressor [Fulvimonas yonginensis]|uniref:Metal-sensing transcriptional repressor n=1 Tax=Fulvimonas yonginensis TaxID=1495200 RepID=A0ABU8JCJ2_9GAMM
MPYSSQEKKRALVRVRRIGGQLEALAQALEREADCPAVLQQIAAVRGAVNGLMADVLESHLRASFGNGEAAPDDAVEHTLALVRAYLK